MFGDVIGLDRTDGADFNIAWVMKTLTTGGKTRRSFVDDRGGGIMHFTTAIRLGYRIASALSVIAIVGFCSNGASAAPIEGTMSNPLRIAIQNVAADGVIQIHCCHSHPVSPRTNSCCHSRAP